MDKPRIIKKDWQWPSTYGKRDVGKRPGDALKLFGCFVSEKFFQGESTNSREYYRPESVDSALIWRIFLAEALNECCQDELLCDLEQAWKTWSQAVRDRLHKHLKTSGSSHGAALSDYDFHPLVARNNAGETSPSICLCLVAKTTNRF